MDHCGIERLCLSALGRFGRKLFLQDDWDGRVAHNQDVAAAVRAHPDRIVGFGFVQLGVDKPETVDRLVDQGFTGLKFHFPAVPYDDPVCFGVYERAARHRMPMLFHTGIFTLPEPMPAERVGSANCQPVYVDRVANSFPDLPMILAHMGGGWFDVAAMMARILPNVYIDVSGGLNGWRNSYPPEHWRHLLYWDGSHEKILFGSDVNRRELEQTVQSQTRFFSRIGYTQSQINTIFYDNAQKLLGATAPCIR